MLCTCLLKKSMYPGKTSVYYTGEDWNENFPIKPGGYRSCSFYPADRQATIIQVEFTGNKKSLQKVSLFFNEKQEEFTTLLMCRKIAFTSVDNYLTVSGTDNIFNIVKLFFEHNKLGDDLSRNQFKLILGIKVKARQ